MVADKRGSVLAAIGAVLVIAVGVGAYTLWPTPTTAGRPVPVGFARVPSVATEIQLAPHDYVAPAAPTSFVMAGAAFRITAKVCQMDFILPLDPPGDQFHTVCWVKRKFGVAPGSSAAGTSYILGHAWAEAPLVFNPLSNVGMKQVNHRRPTLEAGVKIYPITAVDNYTVTLRTPNGTLVYTVTRAFAVKKSDAIKVQSIMATDVPNRLVLITCGVSKGVDIDDNVIVYADLTSSVSS